MPERLYLSVVSFLRLIVLLPLLTSFHLPAGSQTGVLQQTVVLDRQYSTIYSILNQISNQTGYYFVYSTEILDSDKKVRLRTGDMPLVTWLNEIIDDPLVDYYIIDNHILVYRPEVDDAAINKDSGNTEKRELIIRGRILDESSRNPLPFATVGIKYRAAGIITNSDGVFTLKLTEDDINSQIFVSHIGFQTQSIPVKLFQNDKVDILLETDYISIQEVMIRYYDPVVIVNAAREKINDNYSDEPVYLLNFYREGVMRSNRFINYSEALFQIYKSPYTRKFDRDQVRLLQSRTISNIDQTDTLILKIRAGIRSSLELDFVKNIPDFLNKEYLHEYDFTKADIVSRDGNRAYAIAFEQKRNITRPLYTGILYIDIESLAFLGADFEVHPKYINKARDKFFTRKNSSYRASVEQATYTVSYKYFDGSYHLNHVRADLNLRYRRRYQIFGKNYHVFVEMATSRIDTDDVARFDRADAFRTDRIFIDENHSYDPDFWSNYSIIAPENHITHAISLIESKIESIVQQQE